MILAAGSWRHRDQFGEHDKGRGHTGPDEQEAIDCARWPTTGGRSVFAFSRMPGLALLLICLEKKSTVR